MMLRSILVTVVGLMAGFLLVDVFQVSWATTENHSPLAILFATIETPQALFEAGLLTTLTVATATQRDVRYAGYRQFPSIDYRLPLTSLDAVTCRIVVGMALTRELQCRRDEVLLAVAE